MAVQAAVLKPLLGGCDSGPAKIGFDSANVRKCTASEAGCLSIWGCLTAFSTLWLVPNERVSLVCYSSGAGAGHLARRRCCVCACISL
jgi:hypothetical protein